MNKSTIVSGIIGGLVAGVVFGIMMGAMGMLPMVAKLVGSSSAIVGFIVHLGNAAVIGVIYGFLLGDRFKALGPSLVAGASYGVIWWILGPLTLMPLFLGMGLGVNWSIAAAQSMLPSLMGHILYGVVLAFTYTKVKSKCGASCSTTG